MKALICFFIPIYLIAQAPIDQAREAYAQNNFQKALSILNAYIEDSPNDQLAIELLGDTYGKLEKWEQAKENYKILAEKHPQNANYHYKYGGVMGMMALENKLKAIGLIDPIKSEFKKAAELDPHHIDVRWALVEFYMELPGFFGGSMDTALKYADELEGISKVDGYLAKAFIYEKDKDGQKAENYYKKALTVGGSKTCYEKLGTFYENQNRFKDAIATYQNGFDRLKDNSFLYKIGELSVVEKIELQQGITALNNFVLNTSKGDKQLPMAHYRLAQIYRELGNKPKAMTHIDVALEMQPNHKVYQKERTVISKI